MFILLLTALSASLSGCASPQGLRLDQVVTADAARRDAAPSDAMRLVCGQPTRWTRAQAAAVADTMVRHADEAGMQLLAPEWERLDNQVRTCRREPRGEA
jgi:hypothetical protein